MTIYKAVRETSLPDLNNTVNILLSGGWSIVGGVSVQGDYFYQTLTKEVVE